MPKGKKASNETRAKMSQSHSGQNNHMYGRTHTEASRKKISDANKGIGAGENNNFFGKTHTAETKHILSEARKNIPKLKCQHCEKIIDPANHKRWHGDNCKFTDR